MALPAWLPARLPLRLPFRLWRDDLLPFIERILLVPKAVAERFCSRRLLLLAPLLLCRVWLTLRWSRAASKAARDGWSDGVERFDEPGERDFERCVRESTGATMAALLSLGECWGGLAVLAAAGCRGRGDLGDLGNAVGVNFSFRGGLWSGLLFGDPLLDFRVTFTAADAGDCGLSCPPAAPPLYVSESHVSSSALLPYSSTLGIVAGGSVATSGCRVALAGGSCAPAVAARGGS